MEDYEARRWYNFDEDPARYGISASELQLVNPVEGIYTKSCEWDNNKEDNPLIYNNPNGIFTGTSTATTRADNMKKACSVYPIPMYIPLIEGFHACDTKISSGYTGTAYPNIGTMRHPDPLGLRTEYPAVVGNCHSMYRAHSANDNNPLFNKIYKRDAEGYAAHRSVIPAKVRYRRVQELYRQSSAFVNPSTSAPLTPGS